MAGATQHRSRGPVIQTPSASSDDGTLADAPLAGAPLKWENSQQQAQAAQFGKFLKGVVIPQ